MSADDRSVPRRLLAAAADEPMLALFVAVLLLMALGFLLVGAAVLPSLL